MSKTSFLLFLLTVTLGIVVGGLAFTVLKLFASARQLSRGRDEPAGETALMTAAMQEAVARLRVREQAMTARAEASERLSGEIIAGLTSGLLVVGEDRRVKSLNPAGKVEPSNRPRTMTPTIAARGNALCHEAVSDCVLT